MTWLVVSLLLALYDIPKINSSTLFPPSYPPLSPLNNSTEDKVLPGRKAQFKMYGVSLTFDQSLSRKIENDVLVRVYNGEPSWLGHIPFIVGTIGYMGLISTLWLGLMPNSL